MEKKLGRRTEAHYLYLHQTLFYLRIIGRLVCVDTVTLVPARVWTDSEVGGEITWTSVIRIVEGAKRQLRVL